MKENYLSGKPRPRELQWFEVTYIRNAGTRQAKSEQGCNTLLKRGSDPPIGPAPRGVSENLVKRNDLKL